MGENAYQRYEHVFACITNDAVPPSHTPERARRRGGGSSGGGSGGGGGGGFQPTRKQLAYGGGER